MNNQTKCHLKEKAMLDYIQLLEKELDNVTPYARMKGYQTSKEDIDKGIKLRKIIFKDK